MSELDRRKRLRWGALLVLVVTSRCAGQVEGEGEGEPERIAECTVDFRGAPCSFACSDCYSQSDCENAVATAVDECLFERLHP